MNICPCLRQFDIGKCNDVREDTGLLLPKFQGVGFFSSPRDQGEYGWTNGLG